MRVDENRLAAELERQTLLRRAWMGVGAVGVGAALALVAVLGTVLLFSGKLPHSRGLKLFAVFVIVGIGTVGQGVRLIQRGEIDLDSGDVVPGQRPVPLGMVV